MSRSLPEPAGETAASESGGTHKATHLEWAGCRNARDLGGMPAAGGARVRHGALVRTDDLTRLEPDGRVTFDAFGAGLILDLRFAFEAEDVAHPYVGHPAYRLRPFVADGFFDDPDEDAELTRGEVYSQILDGNPKTVAAAVREVASASESAVVVHCVSGKDRTGLLVALLLDLVGVPRELIAADYALSEERLELLALLARMEDDGASAEELAKAGRDWLTPPQGMLDTLEHLDRAYGGTRGYLRDIGLTEDELHRLANRLLDRT